MLRSCLFCLSALVLVASCGPAKDSRVYFDGAHFRAKAKKADADVAEFYVVVPKASQTLEGARQAGEYEGIRYCIKNLGTSKIDWTVGPQADATVQMTDKDAIVLRGVCEI